MSDVDDGYRSLGQTVSDTRNQVAKGKEDRKSDRASTISGGLRSIGDRQSQRSSEASSRIGPVQYKRGGRVRKTGIAKVHRGERVIPAGKRKKVERLMKRAGMRMKARR